MDFTSNNRIIKNFRILKYRIIVNILFFNIRLERLFSLNEIYIKKEKSFHVKKY